MTCKCTNLACKPTHPEGHCPNKADGFFCFNCKNVPIKRNGGVICDVIFGPCACGAWHGADRVRKVGEVF